MSLTSPTSPTFPTTQTTIDEQTTNNQRTTVIHPVSISGTHRVVDVNRATMSYCYTAMLFFFALLVTWVPSTINRLYTLIRPNASAPFGLDFASGLVLPLQGFWNTVIYIVTSLAACKALLIDIGRCLNCFTRRSSHHPEKSDLNPRMRRHAAQLGSADTTDHGGRPSVVNSTYSHTEEPIRVPKEAVQEPLKTVGRDSSLPGTPRADIVISFDGKKRVIHHDYRSSVPENRYNPFEKQKEEEYTNQWVPPPERIDDEENQTRLYDSTGPSSASIVSGSTFQDDGSDESFPKANKQPEAADSGTGIARFS
jgi:hypothetical protein